MNDWKELLNDLNDSWKKNIEDSPFWLNLNQEIQKLFENSRSWWNNLTPEWKAVFLAALKIYRPGHEPSDQELKNILMLEQLDCSDASITHLNPLKNIKNLRSLNCSNTGVASLEPLQFSMQLLQLSCSNTQVASLKPLRKLQNLRVLDCSMTDVDNLQPLNQLIHLKELNISATFVKNLKPLYRLQKLKELNCENCPLSNLAVKRFKRKFPGTQIIFTLKEKKRGWFW